MSVEQITSRDNKLYKQWLSLGASKGIERHGLALVSGRKIVPELLAERGGGATLIYCEGMADFSSPVYAGGPAQPGRGQPSQVGEEKLEAVQLARDLFDSLDEFGTNVPLLVLPVPEIAKFESDGKPPRGLTLAIAAQDPSNLGAILRSALAFEANNVVLLAQCAHPFLPRVTRAAAGANFRVKLLKGPSINALGAEWIALDMQGDVLDETPMPQDCALLLGEEGPGIPDSFAGRRVRIPIGPRAESLNAAVAAGIVLAAYRRQHPQ